MAIKYKRDEYQRASLGPDNRYEVQRGFMGKDPKRRLLIIYIGIGAFSVLLLAFHLMSQRISVRWLPDRTGQAVIVDKWIQEDVVSGPIYLISIKVLVPPASSDEATMVPRSTPDRTDLLGALELVDEVSTTAENWRSIAAGTPVNVVYQINARRSRVDVHEISVLEPSGPGNTNTGSPGEGGKLAAFEPTLPRFE